MESSSESIKVGSKNVISHFRRPVSWRTW